MQDKVADPASDADASAPSQGRPLSPAARRALAEAGQRREAALRSEAGLPREFGGRGGLDPARYGDWEVKGVASDF